MVKPPDRDPYFITIFLSDAEADFDTRNAAVIELSEAVMQIVTSRRDSDGRACTVWQSSRATRDARQVTGAEVATWSLDVTDIGGARLPRARP
jgi:hypothetical protein